MEHVSEISEQRLAFLCAKGDKDAQRELYRRYATRLSMLCSRYSAGPSEGMDLMHDAMIKALHQIGRYHYMGEGSLFRWLCRLAINMSVDKFKRERRFEVGDTTFEILDQEAPSQEETRGVPLEVLQRMVSSLSDSKRLVFNMFCIDGFSHKEIGEKLGITEKASSSTLAKAKKTLAWMIKEYNEKHR